ncbi:MAG: V-type ATPase subunit [Theionarchaea archaeon]|nr:V-type ATPase subunit [Theionarchaea archaeon]
MSESSYAYAFGRVRALETELMDSTQIKRMIDARTAQDALKTLSETSYGSYLPDSPDIPDIEKALIEELKKTYEIVRNISPQREITDLFELQYDIHNLKILLKSEITGISFDELLIPLGREGPESLAEALEGDLKAVSPFIGQTIEKARIIYGDTKDFQKVQFFLDREHARLLHQGFLKIPFLTQFFMLKIDLENIRNAIRAHRVGLPFEDIFLPGGSYPVAFFTEIKDQPAEYFMEKTRNRDYAEVVTEGLTQYQKIGSLSLYEKNTDDFLMNYMKKAKFYSLSIEPVAGYLFAKEREVRILRQILIGKMKHIDVTQRVSEVYE